MYICMYHMHGQLRLRSVICNLYILILQLIIKILGHVHARVRAQDIYNIIYACAPIGDRARAPRARVRVRMRMRRYQIEL